MQTDRVASRRWAGVPALWILSGAFCSRVLAQMLVEFFQVDFLPASEEWFSGLIPYPRLLISQILLILLLGKISLDLTRGKGWFATPRRWLATTLLACGTVYLLVMIIRYVLRMGLYPMERWTGGSIPIFFHWVLAAAVLLIGSYHRRYSKPPSGGRFGRLFWLRKATWTSVTLLVATSIAAWVAYLVAPAWLASFLLARPNP